MNIYEWSAIEAFKRGDRGPLIERWKKLEGKPLSPLLHQFILRHFIEGKPLRKRGRPPTATKTAIIQTAYIAATTLDPSEKKTAIHADLKELGKLKSTKRIEQIVYRMPKSSSRSPQKKPKPSRRSRR